MPKAAESANAKMLVAIKPRMIDAANVYFTDSTVTPRDSRTYCIDSGKIKPGKVKAQSALGIRSKLASCWLLKTDVTKGAKVHMNKNEQCSN